MFFDSHAHYDDARFDGDRGELLQNMGQSGVSGIINVGADLASSKRAVALSEKYPFIYAAVGVHPHDAKDMGDLDEIRRLCEHPKVVAIGEIGLDYHYDNSPRDVQKNRFKEQLALAAELGLPFIIHSRDASADMLEILSAVKEPRGVMHCFSGSAETAEILLGMGLFLSFAGPITYKNNKKTIAAASVTPLDKMLIETDSPYLAPVPHRGERNNSAYVRYVAEKIAEIKGISVSEVARATAENARRLFDIAL